MTDSAAAALPPIYVISLARAAKRRADITARLNAAGVRYELTDAVDYKKLDFDNLPIRIRQEVHLKNYQVEIAPGTIGCVMSHMNLWRRIAAEQIPAALILEDDAVWDDDFWEVLGKLAASAWDFDMVMLSHIGGSKKRRVLEQLTGNRQLVLHRRPGWMTAAYLIRLSGANKLLPYCFDITGGADALTRENWRTGLRTYNVKPSPVTTPTEGTLSDPAPRPPLTPRQQLRRARMRLYRGFRRGLHYFLRPPRKRQ